MTKEKIQSITKYVSDIKNRLSSPTPGKWAHAPEAYKTYLERELRLSNKKLDDAKMGTDGKGAK